MSSSNTESTDDIVSIVTLPNDDKQKSACVYI